MRIIVAAIVVFLSAPTAWARELEKAATEKLVEFVDSLKLPIEKRLLGEAQPIGDGGDDDPALKIDKSMVESHAAFKEGLEATLIGPRERPLAVIFWVQSGIGYYYVPFSGVSTIDRPRRLTKLDKRCYRIESNRSSRVGVRVEKILP